MRRRDFIKALAASSAAWPRLVHAQQAARMRRAGVLMNTAADNAEAQLGVKSFQEVLQQSGWSEERDLHFDVRWGENDIDRERRFASELVALAPDVLLASGTVSVTSLQHVTHTVKIVFVQVSDPVGAG